MEGSFPVCMVCAVKCRGPSDTENSFPSLIGTITVWHFDRSSNSELVWLERSLHFPFPIRTEGEIREAAGVAETNRGSFILFYRCEMRIFMVPAEAPVVSVLPTTCPAVVPAMTRPAVVVSGITEKLVPTVTVPPATTVAIPAT
jgi:hypothetical protein